jgi:hypothetical protein
MRLFVFFALALALVAVTGFRSVSAQTANPAGGLTIPVDSIRATAHTKRVSRRGTETWSWAPSVECETSERIPSGGVLYLEYSIPKAGAPVQVDCELSQNGDRHQCNVWGPKVPDDKYSTYTGAVSFSVKLRNELDASDTTLFRGRMNVKKTLGNSSNAKANKEFVYFVDQDWNLPIGYVHYDVNQMFRVSFWARGDGVQFEPHLFFKGQEIGRAFLDDGTPIGRASCGSDVDLQPTHYVDTSSTPEGAKWSRVRCEFPMVRRTSGTSDMFETSSNPGEYEVKVLRRNKLARSIKLTLGADGTVESSAAPSNGLRASRAIVPVAVIGDQDGAWDRKAWKTEAFYGNPLTGFAPPTP